MALTLTNEDRAQIVAMFNYLTLGYNDGKAGASDVVLDPQILTDLAITGVTIPTTKKLWPSGSTPFGR